VGHPHVLLGRPGGPQVEARIAGGIYTVLQVFSGGAHSFFSGWKIAIRAKDYPEAGTSNRR
jgi:hypothetical protein